MMKKEKDGVIYILTNPSFPELLRLHGGRARAVGSPVHLRLIVDAVRVLRAVATQELPERGGGLLCALLAVIGSNQQHDGQHRERDGRIIQRLRHKITQHRAQRREHEPARNALPLR